MTTKYFALIETVEVGDEVRRGEARFYARTPEQCERELLASWNEPSRNMSIVEVSRADYDAETECPTPIDPDIDYRGWIAASER